MEIGGAGQRDLEPIGALRHEQREVELRRGVVAREGLEHDVAHARFRRLRGIELRENDLKQWRLAERRESLQLHGQLLERYVLLIGRDERAVAQALEQLREGGIS